MNRRRLRMWLLVGFAPFALAGLVLVVKILSMYAFAHQAITSHVQQNPQGTVSAAQGQQPMNWFEPYKAPYNLGVGLASLELLTEAREQFEIALPLAHGLDKCPVHINLALVVERMGDAARADDPAAAAQLYAEALELNLNTPEDCRSEEANEQSPDPERDTGETLDDQQDRLQEKQQPQDNEQPQDEEQQQEPSEQEQQEQQDKLDEIEEKLEQGAEEREGSEDEGGSGGGSDKPW